MGRILVSHKDSLESLSEAPQGQLICTCWGISVFHWAQICMWLNSPPPPPPLFNLSLMHMHTTQQQCMLRTHTEAAFSVSFISHCIFVQKCISSSLRPKFSHFSFYLSYVDDACRKDEGQSEDIAVRRTKSMDCSLEGSGGNKLQNAGPFSSRGSEGSGIQKIIPSDFKVSVKSFHILKNFRGDFFFFLEPRISLLARPPQPFPTWRCCYRALNWMLVGANLPAPPSVAPFLRCPVFCTCSETVLNQVFITFCSQIDDDYWLRSDPDISITDLWGKRWAL